MVSGQLLGRHSASAAQRSGFGSSLFRSSSTAASRLSNWKPSKPAATYAATHTFAVASAGSGVPTRTVPVTDAKASQISKLELSTPQKGLCCCALSRSCSR